VSLDCSNRPSIQLGYKEDIVIGLFFLTGMLAFLGLYPLISAIIKIQSGWDFHYYLNRELMWETVPGAAGQIQTRNNMIGICYVTFLWEGFAILLATTAFVPEVTAAQMFLGFFLFCWLVPFVAQPICGRKFNVDLPEILSHTMN
jgi:hypothetical protein